MQAVHDILAFKWNISKFDHLKFPGVVPRTFMGPLVISMAVAPWSALINLGPSFLRSLFYPQPRLILTRLALGTASIISLSIFRKAVAARFTRSTSVFFAAITMSQFHLIYYAGRTIPNIFALAFVNIALAEWIHPRGNFRRSISLLSFACALFRSELALLIFTLLAVWLFASHAGSLRYKATVLMPVIIAHGFISALFAATVSILVDSWFWRRLCYPELEVFYFNVVLNKSSGWGTEPWHWYFSSALPKALGGALPLAALGLWSYPSDVGLIVAPSVVFVALYSVLPHKELRFIFYAIPSLNIAAASGLDFIYRQFRRRYRDGCLRKDKAVVHVFCAAICIAISVAMTCLSLAASIQNYPAAHALLALQRVESSRGCTGHLCAAGSRSALTSVRVHIDTESAMNGITRFLEIPTIQNTKLNVLQEWHYSRDEGLSDSDLLNFTHLISHRPNVTGFSQIYAQDGYAGITLHHGVPRIRTQPRAFVHARSLEE